jgi:hypothetical protein
MSNKLQKDIEEIEIILAEISKFSYMSTQELKNCNELWRFHTFNAFVKGKKVDLIYGKKSFECLLNISKRYLRTKKEYSENIDINVFIEQLLYKIIERFYVEKRLFSESEVQKIFSSVVRIIKQGQMALTHYIPCVLISGNTPQYFNMGPVKFERIESFLLNHEDELNKTIERIKNENILRRQDYAKYPNLDIDLSDDAGEKLAHRLMDGVKKYFTQYGWVASVSIPSCDISISEARAQRTIELSLNIFKLFINDTNGYKLRQGHNIFGDLVNTAKLTKDTDDIFKISLTGKTARDVFVEDNWFDLFSKEAVKPYINGIITALNTCIEPMTNHLIQRIIDGLFWFGQAVSERNISVKIIKYMAAIERITITEKSENITKNVTQRMAILDHLATNERLDICYKKSCQIYEVRSNLMHGSVSPFDEKLFEIKGYIHEMAKNIILLGINLFEIKSHQFTKDIKPSDLEKVYQIIESRYHF